MSTITFDRIRKTFGDAVALHELSLEVPSGAFLVLLGPSGCGKTTALRLLAGLEEPSGGSIRLGERTLVDAGTGRRLPAGRRGIGLVFQSYALWPHMSVRQNIEWPLTVAGWSRAKRRERAREVLEMLEIEALADRHPAQLSGGQQQRVAIARTLAPGPEVLLFDEPLSNLDARLRVDTRAELIRVHRSSGATSVYVTHDQIEALAMATHIAVLDGGRLEQFGTPEELLERPATPFVASFLGTPPAVLLPGSIEAGRFIPEREGRRVPQGESVVRGLYRADEIELTTPAPDTLVVDVLEVTPMAGRRVVTVAHRGRRLSVVSEHRVRPGDTAGLRLHGEPRAVFDAAGARLAGPRHREVIA